MRLTVNAMYNNSYRRMVTEDFSSKSELKRELLNNGYTSIRIYDDKDLYCQNNLDCEYYSQYKKSVIDIHNKEVRKQLVKQFNEDFNNWLNN